MKKIPKNIIIISVSAVVVIAGLVATYFLITGSQKATPTITAVQQGDITESTILYGNVKASQGVDLSFETQGRIVGNYVKVGEKIYAGQTLLAIDNSGLQAQLKQAQAQLDALDISIVQNKNSAALQSLYMSSLSAAQKSATIADNALLSMTDIQYNYFTDQSQGNLVIQNAKAAAVLSLLGQSNAGTWNSESLSTLNGGALATIQTAVNNPTNDTIDAALTATLASLEDMRAFINTIPIKDSFTATEKATVAADKDSINSEIIATSGNIQGIATLKVNNSATVSTTDAQIEAAKANVDAIKTQLAKTVLTSLFSGQVDKDDTVVGSIASPNVPVISISNNNLEIDTNIPEIDIAKVVVSSNASVTLDAYGTTAVFPATVVSIDSVESMADDVPVYQARLKFNANDSRIKPGLTANITITSQTHKNVLFVPKSAIIQKNGKYYVLVADGNSQTETREVTIGISDDQNMEIVSGLQLNEQVISY